MPASPSKGQRSVIVKIPILDDVALAPTLGLAWRILALKDGFLSWIISHDTGNTPRIPVAFTSLWFSIQVVSSKGHRACDRSSAAGIRWWGSGGHSGTLLHTRIWQSLAWGLSGSGWTRYAYDMKRRVWLAASKMKSKFYCMLCSKQEPFVQNNKQKNEQFQKARYYFKMRLNVLHAE